MLSAADVEWVDHWSRHNPGLDIAFIQQFCYIGIVEINAAIHLDIILQVTSDTILFLNYPILLSNSKHQVAFYLYRIYNMENW